MFKRTAVPPVGSSDHQARQPLNMALGLLEKVRRFSSSIGGCMSWNYRVVRVDGQLQVFDVYYNATGLPHSRHVTPSFIYGETLEHLSEQLDWIREALEKPILEDSEIGGRADGAALKLG
jgi:hypothetical protein